MIHQFRQSRRMTRPKPKRYSEEVLVSIAMVLRAGYEIVTPDGEILRYKRK